MASTQGLKPGYFLRHDTYRIEKVLGQGGFGITYLAYDLNLERYVAIKEFFPKALCDRDATTSHVTLGTKNNFELVNRLKAKFLKEARNIAKLDNPNIIRIFAAFEENNTAYYVMEYIEGESLSTKVKKNGPLPEKRALVYIKMIGEALEYVHERKINHLDVKPANIMVRSKDDTPILIDFGLSKQYDSDGTQTSTMLPGFSHGFAPIEQYNDGGVKVFSPQTDVYSLAATLYYLLSGLVPIQATRRNDEELTFPQTIPVNLISPISKAMSVGRKNRQENIKDFITELENSRTNSLNVISKSTLEKNPTPITPTLREKLTKWIKRIDIVLGSVTVIIFLVWFIGSTCSVKRNIVALEGEDIEIPEIEELCEEGVVIQNIIDNMVYVEGGTFIMREGEDHFSYPEHIVNVESFYIGKYEVTQKEWHTVMGTNPSKFTGEDLPVENVTLEECQEFIDNLNCLSGYKFRLPTEEEWEFAAQGGNLTNGYKYAGSNDINTVAWYGENSGRKTHKVGTKKSNELGLYDMSGNVWEITSSFYNNGANIVRGGGWSYNDSSHCTVNHISHPAGPEREDDTGLRLAL